MNPPPFERLLRAREVAELLGISRTSAYRMMQSGDLPTVRLMGKTVRVRASDLSRLMNTQGKAKP